MVDVAAAAFVTIQNFVGKYASHNAAAVGALWLHAETYGLAGAPFDVENEKVEAAKDGDCLRYSIKGRKK